MTGTIRNSEGKLTRIGVFYDGNFFSRVSNYYAYSHKRRARISLPGLHQFLIAETAKAEDTAARHSRIVDSHFFRGRLSACEANRRDSLYGDRIFDEILMKESITTHYLPLSNGAEKGIDIMLALTTYDEAIHKGFDIVVLIAGDGDYVPLIRKLNTLGTRVMVLGWDFTHTDKHGVETSTRTAQSLLNEANYPVLMNHIVDDRSKKSDPLITNLFVKNQPKKQTSSSLLNNSNEKAIFTGNIINLNEGFGFITTKESKESKSSKDNLFFHHSNLQNCDFNSLQMGNEMTYEKGTNSKGDCAENIFLKVNDQKSTNRN